MDNSLVLISNIRDSGNNYADIVDSASPPQSEWSQRYTGRGLRGTYEAVSAYFTFHEGVDPTEAIRACARLQTVALDIQEAQGNAYCIPTEGDTTRMDVKTYTDSEGLQRTVKDIFQSDKQKAGTVLVPLLSTGQPLQIVGNEVLVAIDLSPLQQRVVFVNSMESVTCRLRIHNTTDEQLLLPPAFFSLLLRKVVNRDGEPK